MPKGMATLTTPQQHNPMHATREALRGPIETTPYASGRATTTPTYHQAPPPPPNPFPTHLDMRNKPPKTPNPHPALIMLRWDNLNLRPSCMEWLRQGVFSPKHDGGGGVTVWQGTEQPTPKTANTGAKTNQREIIDADASDGGSAV